MQDVELSDAKDTTLVWRWTADGVYSSRSTYTWDHTPVPAATGSRKSGHRFVSKYFLWLSVRRRHWTADRRVHHGLEATEHWFLCDEEMESVDHIIASCSYSRQVWWHILQALGVDTSQGGKGQPSSMVERMASSLDRR